MSETVSLEVAIEVVLRDGPTFETIAGLCKMAVETEREACAMVADALDPEQKTSNYGQVIANRIRARGQA